MLKLLFFVFGGYDRENRWVDRKERRYFGQWTYVFALMVVAPVVGFAALSFFQSLAVAGGLAVGAVVVPGTVATACDRAMRVSGVPPLFAGRWSRSVLVLLWAALLVPSVLWLKSQSVDTAVPHQGRRAHRTW